MKKCSMEGCHLMADPRWYRRLPVCDGHGRSRNEEMAALRLALAEATRDAEGHAANVKLVQVNRDVWQTRALTAERERDEAISKRDEYAQSRVAVWEAKYLALSRARETDGAVREAAERLRYKLTPPASVTENGCVFASAEDIETVLRALSSPPRPETKGDDKGGAA